MLARSDVDMRRGNREGYGSDVTDSSSSSSTIHVDYNPVSGVTFRENRNSDVQVVGRGYSDDTIPTAESKATAAANNKSRRRTQKGTCCCCEAFKALWQKKIPTQWF